MAVVTVARQLGAGSTAVANRVAELLGWRLLDRELVEQIAADLRVAPEQVEMHDERVETFIERLGQYLSEGFPEGLPVPVVPPVSPESAARVAGRIITRVVGEEGPAVIVGHGSQCLLRGDARAFHVLLHAPFELRAGQARERYRVSAREATERVRQSDWDRMRYIREHFDCDWLDPELYDLCVNTGRLGVEGSAAVIRTAAECFFGDLGRVL
ncbi:MAG: AAA family ATPase [Longimicrobiaceae bacterium]